MYAEEDGSMTRKSKYKMMIVEEEEIILFKFWLCIFSSLRYFAGCRVWSKLVQTIGVSARGAPAPPERIGGSLGGKA